MVVGATSPCLICGSSVRDGTRGRSASCGGGVRPTCSRRRVRRSSTSCHPRGTCSRCRESHSCSDCSAHGTTDHDDSTCFSCFPAIGHGADRDVVCAAGDKSNFVISTDGAGSCVCCLWSMQTNDTLLLLFFRSFADLM